MKAIKFFLFLFLFVLILSTQNSIGTNIDYYQVGVNEGDTFQFEVLNYESTNSGGQGYTVGVDYNAGVVYFAQQGDEFIITVVDPTVVYDPLAELSNLLVQYSIHTEIEFDGITFEHQNTVAMTVFGGDYISSTDWTNIADNLTQAYEELAVLTTSIWNEISFNVVELPDEFKLELYLKRDSVIDRGISLLVEIRQNLTYQKSNGVLLYREFSMHQESGDFSDDEMFIIARKIDQNDESSETEFNLNFQFISIEIGLLSIWFAIYKKRKNNH